MKRSAALVAIVAAALGSACADQRSPLAPADPTPFFQIRDDLSNPNPRFLFLAPIRLSELHGRTGFNPHLRPVVEICKLSGTVCDATPPVRLTMTSGSATLNRVFVLPDLNEYAALWVARNLVQGKSYRIRVLVGGQELGFADLDVVRTLTELLKYPDRGNFVPLLKDFILPIRFWIGKNALCADPASTTPCSSATIDPTVGGEVALGFDKVVIPAQNADGVRREFTLTLQNCPRADIVDLLSFQTCVRATVDPPLTETEKFSPFANVLMCSFESAPDPNLPAAGTAQREVMTLYREDDQGNVFALPKSTRECLAPSPINGLNGLNLRNPLDLARGGWRALRGGLASLFVPRPLFASVVVLDVGGGGDTPFMSNFRLGLPARMDIVEGTTGFQVAPGAPVPTPPAVLVTDATGARVTGARVTFKVTAGGGTITGPAGSTTTEDGAVQVLTVNGVAALASWTVGPTPGTNTVRAFARAVAVGEQSPFVHPERNAQPVPATTGEIFFTATSIPATEGTWAATGSLEFGRRDHTATLLKNGDVLIVGGTASGAFIYHADIGSFTATEGAPRYSHGQLATATRLTDGRVLVVGGLDAPFGAEIYNPSTGSFTATVSSPTEGGTNASRIAHSATLLSDGRVLLVGGQFIVACPLPPDPAPCGPQTHNAAEIYDPATDAFTPVGSLNDHRSSHGAALLADGRVLIVGGVQTTVPGRGICLSSAELFDPESKTFSATGSMTTGRCDLLWNNATVLGSGKVLVVAGGGKSTELYDPVAGTFALTGSMASLHDAGSSTPLADGRVLVAGGSSGVGPVTTKAAEIYNPTLGVFTPAADLTVPRQEHSATLLLNGRVLIVGGFSSPVGVDVGSAELFSLTPSIP